MANEKLKSGYEVDLVVHTIKNVTPREKFVFVTDEGKEIEAKDGVTIELIRVTEVKSASFGSVTKEYPLSIFVPCEDLKEAQLLYNHLQQMKEKNIPFNPEIILPKKVKSVFGGLEFMAHNKI